ncbi:MAG: hypothetical protein J0H78_20175 [Rhizobiales bacterium]|nr:hypothetical protein [Hyphomicrobiales bacterium]
MFAADSAVTLSYGSDEKGAEIVNVLPHGNKVFNLHRDLPICAMTCGLGNIGAESISSLAKDLRILLMDTDSEFGLDPETYTIEQVAKNTRAFLFEQKYNVLESKPQSDLSFYVGGYSSGSGAPEIWLVTINAHAGSSPEPQRLSEGGGLVWGGQPEAINRLVSGIGINHAAVLRNAGLDDPVVQRVSDALAAGMQMPFLHAAMPVQDAIEFADFLVETTKRFVRFLPGADTVGGDTDIAVVTKHEGFKWARRKHFFSASLNPTEVSYGARYPVEKGKRGHAAQERAVDA